MTESNGPNGYTVKEILTNFVLPELREIKEEVKLKVGRAEFEKLEARMTTLEATHMNDDDVVRIINDQSNASKALGISRSERNIGIFVAVCTVLTVILGAQQAGVLGF